MSNTVSTMMIDGDKKITLNYNCMPKKNPTLPSSMEVEVEVHFSRQLALKSKIKCISTKI